MFDYELGTKPQLTHKPLIVGDRGKPICVYAIAITTNGGEYMELMNMQEIEKCRAVSKASSSPHSPWVKWFDQMAKKTVMHRIAKRLPKNDAINSVVAVDDDNFVDVTPNAKPSEPKDSLSRLRDSIGMEQEEADKAADNVVNNYRKEE